MLISIDNKLYYLKVLIISSDRSYLHYPAYLVSFETIIRYFLPDNLVIVQAINIAVLARANLGEVLINYYGIANFLRPLQTEVDNRAMN